MEEHSTNVRWGRCCRCLRATRSPDLVFRCTPPSRVLAPRVTESRIALALYPRSLLPKSFANSVLVDSFAFLSFTPIYLVSWLPHHMDVFVQRRPKAATGNHFAEPKAEADERPAKRTKRQNIPDSDSDEPDDEVLEFGERGMTPDGTVLEDHESPEPQAKSRPTDVENVLPATQDEEEAIIEYENFKLSQSGSQDGTSSKTAPLWTRGRSSIYVDAFIVALDTVLEDESHLFDDKEKEIFRQWKALHYEAQYL